MLPSRCENAADTVFSTPHSCLTSDYPLSYSLQVSFNIVTLLWFEAPTSIFYSQSIVLDAPVYFTHSPLFLKVDPDTLK